MKKFLSLLITLSMLFSLALPAFGAETAKESADKATDEPEPYVLFSAKDHGGSKVVKKEGKLAFKWGPGEDDLKNNGISDITITPKAGMDKYQYLVIEMYSAKNTNHPFLYRLYGPDNPDTPTDDFYNSGFGINWEGEWRQVKLAIAGGLYDFGDFEHSDSKKPLFKPYEATSLSLSAFPYASSNFYSDTEVYVSKIYLEGKREEKTVPNEKGELIIPGRFDASSMTDYAALVKEKHPDNHHPRLFVTDDAIERIKKYKDTDPFMKKAYAAVKTAADGYLNTVPGAPYKSAVLGTSQAFDRTVEEVAKNCGFMYLLTGDTKYADRIWLEVENMIDCDMYWYQTSTGLDCGHIASGFALAYDWCYDYFTDEQKLAMRNALMTHAFNYALRIRGAAGYMNFRNNVIAANSKGFVTAALAIIDEPGYENFCSEIINLIVEYIPEYLLFQFQPDGNYSEGLGYWRYSVASLFYMTNAMKTAAGTDSGLEDIQGLKETCYLPFAMRGTTIAFNFADATNDALREGDPVYFYMAERYNVPQLATYRLETYERYGGANANDLLWYNPEAPSQTDWRQGLPKDYILDGLEPIAILRTGYDPDSVYLGTKGGNHRTGHDHFDGGSFVLDVFGSRWFEDTGAEEYFTDVDRTWYYRIRTEGHNCIVFDQTGKGNEFGQTQEENLYDGKTPFTDFASTDNASYAVYDLKPCYRDIVKDYKRGFALINNRTQIIIQDEFETTAPYELHSYYHTDKSNEIILGSDGRSLTMKSEAGNYLKINFITDIPDLEVGVMEAVHQPSSPQPGPENTPGLSNSTFKKIYLHSDKVTKGTITMVITPVLEDKEAPLPNILPFSGWKQYLANDASLTGISVDGVPLSDFDSGIGLYKFETEKLGTVTATAPEEVELSITQANAMGEAALIKATNKKSGNTSTYNVTFTPLTIPGVSTGVEFVSVDSPYIPQPENPPSNIHDGNISTRFASDGYDGEAQFVADLGTSRYLKGFSIAFFNGHTRKNKFKVEISEDNATWTTVFDGFSPGNTDTLLAYSFTPAWGRYVRWTGYGCYAGDEISQKNPWNSVNEFVVQEEMVDFADTSSHWAQSEIFFSRSHNLINGVGDNMYMPENPVTRAEFLAMMVRACKFAELTYEDDTFADVKSDDWFADVVMTAKDKGIIPPEMIGDGNLYPDKKLTREEMCAIAILSYTAAAYRNALPSGMTSIFTDLSDGPYLSYIDKAIGLRIVNGMSETVFAPGDNITRAQAAAILRRVYLKIFNVNN